MVMTKDSVDIGMLVDEYDSCQLLSLMIVCWIIINDSSMVITTDGNDQSNKIRVCYYWFKKKKKKKNYVQRIVLIVMLKSWLIVELPLVELLMIVAGWCPPVISWFINPINYSYICHKP